MAVVAVVLATCRKIKKNLKKTYTRTYILNKKAQFFEKPQGFFDLKAHISEYKPKNTIENKNFKGNRVKKLSKCDEKFVINHNESLLKKQEIQKKHANININAPEFVKNIKIFIFLEIFFWGVYRTLIKKFYQKMREIYLKNCLIIV